MQLMLMILGLWRIPCQANAADADDAGAFGALAAQANAADAHDAGALAPTRQANAADAVDAGAFGSLPPSGQCS